MSTFPLKILTPYGLFFDGEIQRVVVRTTTGDVAILKNHTEYLAPLGIGEMRLLMPDGTKRSAACSGGFIRVTKESTHILATTCEWSDEIDIERAKHARDAAEQKLKNKIDHEQMKMAQFKLNRALNRIRIAEKNS